ncbi:ClC family H(+)/Cl(-) exchange transporter [Extibacter muris]|uniref:ClC family H(+)/Cl(-) exchange transporter n=1 Tax=Extibacter muris TaxID=1796622 RepID=UPI001D099733|nr:ClC family H(+)/Cl(-) exchange transporter [Extibacter muris]MCB6201926.1 chloride channel protein [Extibacter muris]MCQ4663263.1 chloride channel protein [Extibacter muris]MCQ4692459.1 chloride channel protein [Extibacter muris]
MKKDTTSMIKRAERFQIILIGEGILVGGIAGLVVLLYRMCLEGAGKGLNVILAYARQSPLRMAGWFLLLMLMAVLVAKLLTYEPMISGSGIPQLEGEMVGKLEQTWWKVLPAKFAGGFLCMLGGLALGREGPSIQIGAMAGKGVSKGLDRGKTEEKFLLTCGASAGLAAAFHAPLAGVMFSLEEVHKNFSVSVLLSVMTASLTADFLSSGVLGVDSVFQFDIVHALPQEYYGLILLLGVVLGAMGAFYNWFTLKVQALYGKAKHLNTAGKVMVPFLCAGILGFTAPELLGSGHSLIEYLTHEDVMLGTVLLILAGRFLFSAVSFGSGAPGGIFFPLLVLGGYIGGAFATAGVQFFGLEPLYINNFVLLAMAGYFSAIVRAPLTGIILIFEMTGSLSQMMSLSMVSIVAYITATLMRSKPIYESLLENLLRKQGRKVTEDHGQKILVNYVVRQGSRLEDALISEIRWPENCLLVSIQRGTQEIIPKGRTMLLAGDTIVTMTDERDRAVVHDKMERLCSDMF